MTMAINRLGALFTYFVRVTAVYAVAAACAGLLSLIVVTAIMNWELTLAAAVGVALGTLFKYAGFWKLISAAVAGFARLAKFGTDTRGWPRNTIHRHHREAHN